MLGNADPAGGASSYSFSSIYTLYIPYHAVVICLLGLLQLVLLVLHQPILHQLSAKCSSYAAFFDQHVSISCQLMNTCQLVPIDVRYISAYLNLFSQVRKCQSHETALCLSTSHLLSVKHAGSASSLWYYLASCLKIKQTASEDAYVF